MGIWRFQPGMFLPERMPVFLISMVWVGFTGDVSFLIKDVLFLAKDISFLIEDVSACLETCFSRKEGLCVSD